MDWGKLIWSIHNAAFQSTVFKKNGIKTHDKL